MEESLHGPSNGDYLSSTNRQLQWSGANRQARTCPLAKT